MADLKTDLLNDLYLNYKHPSSLSGEQKLWKAARLKDETITQKNVRDYLSTKDSYTLHRITKKRFPRRKMLAPGPKVIISCDLADMRNLSKYNDGYNYILICIDIFSKYLSVQLLKRKNAASLLEALREILERSEYENVSRLLTDRGSEFYNKLVESYLLKKKIKLYSVSSYEIKASIAERVIQTLKNKIYRHLTEKNTYKYIHVLPDLVNNYNNSFHRILGLSPRTVHTTNNSLLIENVFRKMYKWPVKAKLKTIPDLDIGETVRIASTLHQSNLKQKSYTIQNTEEIFKIHEIDTKQPEPIYRLIDLNGSVIAGSFYRAEIIPTALPKTFPITILKEKTTKKGKKKYLVSWRGYPSSFNSWIDEKVLQKMT